MSGGGSDGSGGMGGGGGLGPVLNGDGLDGMKSSPANGPGTPRDDGGGMGDYSLGGFAGPPQDNVSLHYVPMLSPSLTNLSPSFP